MEQSIKKKFLDGDLKLDLLFQVLWKNKKIFIINFAVVFVLSAAFALSLPRYYNAKVTLAPEYSSGNSLSSGSLGSLASIAGINLGSMGSEDAIVPTLYPDLMGSTDFLTSLFSVQIETKEGKKYTYADYLANHQEEAWWTSLGRNVKGLFSDSQSKEPLFPVNSFRLNKEQTAMANIIQKKILCVVDKKTSVITLQVEDQDPLVAATLVDTLKTRLQDFITTYRTQKARNDLQYALKLKRETEALYIEKLRAYTAYSDSHQEIFLQEYKSEQENLEKEADLAYNLYNQVTKQVEMAKAKIMERTPAFTTIQNATVPNLPAGPKRSLIVLVCLILTFMGTTIYILLKK